MLMTGRKQSAVDADQLAKQKLVMPAGARTSLGSDSGLGSNSGQQGMPLYI